MADKNDAVVSVEVPSLDLTTIQLEGGISGVKLSDKGAAITIVVPSGRTLIAAMALLVAVSMTGEPVGLTIDRKQTAMEFGVSASEAE